jgi:hypothetical protein
VLFLLAIVLGVRLRFKDSDYPFGIIKLFLNCGIVIGTVPTVWYLFHLVALQNTNKNVDV